MYIKIFRFIKEKFIFLLAFGFSKVAVYIVPLWLADILTKQNYGILEYALAGLGMLVSAGFGLGMPGAYPYFILKKKDLESEKAFSIHPLWLIFIFIINQILYYGISLYNIKIYLALNFAFLIANQQFYSTKLKSKESILKAVLIDSGVYFVLLLFGIAVTLQIVPATLEAISTIIFVYALLYIVYGVISFYKVNKNNIFEKYKAILKFSYHLLLSSILIFAITVGGRIIIEYYFNDAAVGVYSFYYRLAAIVVVIHQITGIMFFKKIYTYNPKVLDKYFSLFFVGIYLVSIFIYFLVPFILPQFSNYYRETYQENKILFFILSAQMLMWIASALNSNIVDREGLAKKTNPLLLLLIGVGLLVIYMLKNQLTLSLLAFVHYSVFYVTVLVQYYNLYKKKIRFKKSIIVITITYLISTSILFFL